MSKSILGLVVALFLALQLRAEQPIFNIGSLSDVSTGQIVNIDFHVDNFSQIISVQYSVNWNPQVLEFKSIKNLNSSVTGLSLSNFNTGSFVSQGKFTLSWIESSTTQVTIPDGSLFFTVEFQVVGEACQSSPVSITDDPLEIEISEDGLNDVGLVTNNGQVTVFGEGCSQDLTINGNSIIGACGTTACVQFTVDNFITVGAMEFSLSYDPAVLQFNRFQNFAPLLAFGEGNTNLFSPGTLRIVWFNGNAQNDTLPNGTVLFEVCFDVIGTGGQSSEITLGNNPAVMISDIDGNLHNVTMNPAEITAQCALEGFALIATDTVCTTPNGITCIDVTVNDFNDIVELQFSMNWDSTKFTFDHLEGFNLTGLDASGFGTPPSPGVKQGQLTCSWLDLTLNGITLPNGTSIFKLCLKAKGAVNTSSVISFTGTPLEVEFSDVDSLLAYTFISGLAQIKTTCDPIETCSISYTINTTSPACPRESTGAVDLNLTLTNCPDIPSYLWSYLGLMTQDLAGIPAGNYTVTITVGSQVVIANTTVLDPDPIGVTGTITDPNPPGGCNGAINITVTGGTPPYSFIWNTTPTVTTEDLTGICAGSYIVTVTDSKGCTFIPDPYIVGADVSASTNNVTCNGGSDGSITLNVSFGTGPYTFIWSPGGATTQNRTNLIAGIHCVTITDNGGSTRDTCFTITQPPALIKTATITHDVNEDCHGAIDLNVTGGTPPYSYQWNTGGTTQDLINLCPGQYCVTITYNGICTMDTCFTINGGGISVSLSANQFGPFQTSCNAACDGSITSNVSGGTSPYSYLWNSGPNTANLSGLCSGTYVLTVTDAGGQTATSSIVLTSPPAINISLLTTLPSDPTAGDGAVSAVVTGGVPNYMYNWSFNGNTTAALSNLFAGIYTVTVTDANQCSATQTADLLGDNVPCFEGLRIITPNSDGKNDYFIIRCILSVNNHLSIYNRNGGLVYETNNYQNNWTGVDEENQPIADGGYLWVLEIFPTNGPPQLLKGTVNVLRTAD